MVKVYSVGGCVRDNILGKKSNDIDYAVEADSFADMKNYIVRNGYKIFLEKEEFLTIRAMNMKNKKVIDFTLCRTDGEYSDYRRPDSVQVGTIYEDLARRDLTINAIAVSLDGHTIDPHGGHDDLQNKIIRAVGDPKDRITEDPLRILRAIRFLVILDFNMEEELDKLLHDDSVVKLLEHISVERKMQELTKMFKHDTIKTIATFNNYKLVSKYTFTDGLWLMPTNKKK